MKISKNTKNGIGLFLALVILFVLFEIYKSWALKSSIETYAVFVGFTGGVGDGCEHFEFRTKENDLIEAKGCTDLKLQIGDTVRIKYSTQNFQYIEVIDRNHEQYSRK